MLYKLRYNYNIFQHNICTLEDHLHINMDENRLTKRVFQWDYIICKNWCFEVKEIFSFIQLQRVYDDMNECSLNKIECNLSEHRNNQWKELLTSKPQLRTYMKFKDNIYTKSMFNIVPLEREDHCEHNFDSVFWHCILKPADLETWNLKNNFVLFVI